MSTQITRRQAVKSIAFGTAGLISSTSLMCQKADAAYHNPQF